LTVRLLCHPLQLRRETANAAAREAAVAARRQLAASASDSAVKAARQVAAAAAAAAADACASCGAFQGENEELDVLWICCDTCNR
jgi:hypothetical protein